MTRPTEAERLRACRELFERAASDGVDMAEAQRRIARERWEASERRLAARRRCGTRATPSARQTGGFHEFSTGEEGERQLAWWQL